MRIAVLHSFYSSRQPSGENDVVLAQVEALSRAGHDVQLIAWETDVEEARAGYPLRAAWRVASGFGPNPMRRLQDYGPDVVHAHNLFPNVGTQWLKTIHFPLVSSMHNYRQVCANGLLYRDGHGCAECLDSTLHAVRHACYRGSRIATAPIAWATRGGVARSPLINASAAVTVPSQRAWQAFVDFGVPSEKLHLLPYFIKDVQTDGVAQPAREGWIVAGRLSPEKGVAELVRSWPVGERLHIAGSGPLETQLASIAPSKVELLGQLSQDRLSSVLSNYEGLVFPGRSPEGIPSIVLHALAAGLPVVARGGNGAADVVSETGLGSVYHNDDHDEIEEALLSVRRRGVDLRSEARAYYKGNFTEGVWVERVESVYDAVQE